MVKSSLIFVYLFTSSVYVFSQSNSRYFSSDSLFIYNQEHDSTGIFKNFHAEPLYIDLIRDLGARKGEREINIGFGLTDKIDHDEINGLIEYEWAPANRLGLEIEVPFSMTYPLFGANTDEIPGSKIEGIKTAIQYSLFVSQKLKSTLALGYINELEFNEFRNFSSQSLIKGNVYNPFLVAAKRWGLKFHTLLYTGPKFEHHFDSQHLELKQEINFSIHYMIGGSRNFVGLETNQEIQKEKYSFVLRPQMRVAIADNFLIGIVSSISLTNEERYGTFIRLIYEPKHKHH